MQNKKIKLAVLESKYGGAVTGVNDLVVMLDKDQFDVTFVYLSGDPACENHPAKAGYKEGFSTCQFMYPINSVLS